LADQFTDRDIALDMLKDMKFLSEGSHRSVLEASSSQIRDDSIQMMNQQLNHHWKIYQLAEKQAWYSPTLS